MSDLQTQPVVDANGDTTGYVSGTRPIQYAAPMTARITLDPEPSCQEPAEHAIHSRLAKVPTDHPERETWKRIAFALTVALEEARRAEYDMEGEGFAADRQPDTPEWDDETTGWRADPIGRDDR